MDWSKEVMKGNSDLSRTKLSRLICEKMGWISSFGKLREADCRKEMIRLEKESVMEFPKSREMPNTDQKGDKLQTELSVPAVSCCLSELGEIKIVLVKTSNLSAIWNSMMKKYHYLEGVRLYGQQLRYLIESSIYGFIGGLSFSSSAWSLDCRDNYIGWSKEGRQSELKHVICNSRFLIHPNVRVKNLASNVMGKVIREMPRDWEDRYGFRPLLLESFVDTTLFDGTCYEASNWIYVGTTKGRGRNDTTRQVNRTIKSVYLYPLDKDWQNKLCLGKLRKNIEQKPAVTDWADAETETLNLNDKRLDRRLKEVLRLSLATPGGSMPERANGDSSKAIAIYRLFDNDKVTLDKILEAHFDATVKRIKEHSIVLIPQDTTELDYSTRPGMKGTGPINYIHSGLLLHDSLALTEQGVPLGVVGAQTWSRSEEDIGNHRNRRIIPIEQKESNKWRVAYQRCEEIQQKCPDTKIISIGDREGDIYELFSEKQRLNAKAELLIRSEKSRSRRCPEGYLWDVLPQEPEIAHLEVSIPRSGSREGRIAVVSVRKKQVELIPPVRKSSLPRIPINCVYIKEIDYVPDKVKAPLEWMLLTTVNVSDNNSALKVVDWYSKRWCIETFHKTLKSGCKIEERQFHDSKRLEACLGIDLITAWRVFFLVKMGREMPNLPCTVFFEECEWKALTCYITKKNRKNRPLYMKQ